MKNPNSTESHPNTIWHHATITRQKRETMNKHKSVVLWFTGLSGSGKSTLAHAVEDRLYQMHCKTFVLDGDNVRHGLCADLEFNDQDRQENIRRTGQVSKLFIEAGIITLTAFISPFREDRKLVRSLFPHGDFFEIFVNCPLYVCEKRDTKGFYKKAREGKIKNFTGIDSAYEEPLNPEITINTDILHLSDSVDIIIHFLISRGIINVAS